MTDTCAWNPDTVLEIERVAVSFSARKHLARDVMDHVSPILKMDEAVAGSIIR